MARTHGLQDAVARGVAVTIVHGLEPVHVDERQHEPSVRAPRPVDLMGQCQLADLAAVCAGQLVEMGRVQLSLEPGPFTRCIRPIGLCGRAQLLQLPPERRLGGRGTAAHPGAARLGRRGLFANLRVSAGPGVVDVDTHKGPRFRGSGPRRDAGAPDPGLPGAVQRDHGLLEGMRLPPRSPAIVECSKRDSVPRTRRVIFLAATWERSQLSVTTMRPDWDKPVRSRMSSASGEPGRSEDNQYSAPPDAGLPGAAAHNASGPARGLLVLPTIGGRMQRRSS